MIDLVTTPKPTMTPAAAALAGSGEAAARAPLARSSEGGPE